MNFVLMPRSAKANPAMSSKFGLREALVFALALVGRL